MKLEKSLIIGIGEILWDVLPEGKQLGGAPANFAYHADQLGAKGLAISRIGNDEDGKEISNKLDEKRLESYLQVDNDHPTGTVTVTVDSEGVPEYIIHEEVAWDYLSVDDKMMEFARSCKAVCFGSLAQRNMYSAKTIFRFLENTDPGSLRIFDINLRQMYYSPELIERSLNICNVVKFNDDEFIILKEMFSMPDDEEAFIRKFIEKFDLKLLALTKGERGSYLADQDQTSFVMTPEIKVDDTIGAGDSFTAAISVGLLEEKPLSEIHKKAVDLSAFVCSQPGGMPEHKLIQ